MTQTPFREADNAGRTRAELREKLVSTRKIVADLQNEYLERNGYSTRVDHRTLKEHGKERKAERHLGQGKIRGMSAVEKSAYVNRRKSDKA